MSAEDLSRALAALGLHGSVEARGALAVLSLAGDPSALRDPALRTRAVELASEHGFTNLALDLSDERRASAPLCRD